MTGERGTTHVYVQVAAGDEEESVVTVRLVGWGPAFLMSLGQLPTEQARLANHIALKVHDAYESAEDST